MKSNIFPFDWRSKIDSPDVEKIGEDIILTDRVLFNPMVDYPFKLDVTVAIICIGGTMSGTVNLKPYLISAPSMFVVISDQILQYKGISEDFAGHFIIMSDRFLESLFIGPQERVPLFLSVHENPCFPLSREQFASIEEYYHMLQKAIRMNENPYRIEMIKHLTQAFFYGTSYQYHNLISDRKKTKQEILAENFINLVKEHFKRERGLDFYAEKLKLTTKHMSKVVRENTGKSASDWIDDYVILEAKALLKSTNMTIQQVSDELSFPTQSFFGKYFKRYVSMSPKVFKKEG